MNQFMKAMDFRHACKKFDEHKKIPDEDFNMILEAGRKSPSSFGLEPWFFLVSTKDDFKSKLRPMCWDQQQITTCSHLVVLLARKAFTFKKGSPYLRESFLRKVDQDTHKLKMAEEKFDHFIQQFGDRVEDWARMQVYLASGNMMSAAAFIGIDSCAIEGFEYDKVDAFLKQEVEFYQDGHFNIAYILCFGYRVHPQRQQLRKKLSEVSLFI